MEERNTAPPRDRDGSLLNQLLAYELRCARRHRRFVSLVLIRNGKSFSDYRELLANLIRDCDELMEFEGGAAILMTETPAVGAAKVMERFRARLAGAKNLRLAAASFPADGQTSDTLLGKGRERLHNAESGL
ncbi:MAG: hypothetical protein HY706_09990 [Candidatus Hydrogenedentes bacterium]|nr:hypothetical protein [Candidatus Hydrogenedentota bacterium]